MAVSLNRRQVVAGGPPRAPQCSPGAARLPRRGCRFQGSRSARAGLSFDRSRPRRGRSRCSRGVPQAVAPDLLDRIDYDAYQKIRYRKARSLQLDRNGRTPVQLFHLGRYFKEPIRIGVVDAGEAREVLYRPELFEIPVGHVARELPEGAGFAGFRVMTPDLETDWLAFLGASYFRSSGPYNQYGLSARGLAIDTGLPTPEEFPRFTEFWLEGPRRATPRSRSTRCSTAPA